MGMTPRVGGLIKQCRRFPALRITIRAREWRSQPESKLKLQSLGPPAPGPELADNRWMAASRLSFGIKTSQSNLTYAEILKTWLEADAVPVFEHAWLWDHLVPLRGPV
jgi:hypothetical protein